MKINQININSIKKKLIPFFKNQVDVRLAFLFGSVAEKRTHSQSDIDIAVFYTKKTTLNRHVLLINDISYLLETDNLDVVNMNSASTFILHDILSFGNLLICKDDDLYRELRLKTLRDFDDLTHIIKIQSQYIFKNVTNG